MYEYHPLTDTYMVVDAAVFGYSLPLESVVIGTKFYVIGGDDGAVGRKECWEESVVDGAGVDGTEVLDGETIGRVYLGMNVRDDFGDVRFTDNDGDTPLDYYMERLVSATYAVFWVEVKDDLSTDPVTIYIYYKHDDETTTSNMANTFLYSSDWEDQLVNWTLEVAQSGDSANATDKYLYLDKGVNQGSNRYYKSIGTLSRLKMHIAMKTPNGATGRCPLFGVYNQAGRVSVYVAIGDSGANVCEYYAGGAYHTIFSGITAQWYHFIVKKADVTPDTYDIYVYDDAFHICCIFCDQSFDYLNPFI
jgi:hypothetical protein